MTVRVTADGSIALEGLCPSEDADTLLQQLLAMPSATVDWRACEGVHMAVIQVLMAARRKLIGPPANPLIKDWVQPLLTETP